MLASPQTSLPSLVVTQAVAASSTSSTGVAERPGGAVAASSPAHRSRYCVGSSSVAGSSILGAGTRGCNSRALVLELSRAMTEEASFMSEIVRSSAANAKLPTHYKSAD